MSTFLRFVRKHRISILVLPLLAISMVLTSFVHATTNDPSERPIGARCSGRGQDENGNALPAGRVQWFSAVVGGERTSPGSNSYKPYTYTYKDGNGNVIGSASNRSEPWFYIQRDYPGIDNNDIWAYPRTTLTVTSGSQSVTVYCDITQTALEVPDFYLDGDGSTAISFKTADQTTFSFESQARIDLGESITLRGHHAGYFLDRGGAQNTYNSVFMFKPLSGTDKWEKKVLATSLTRPTYIGGTAYSNGYAEVTLPADTFTEPGEYLYQFCVDTDASWVGGVNEKDESNNCSGGSGHTIVVEDAISASLTALPDEIELGESSTLTWSSLGATSCTGTGFSTGGATSGSVSVTPSSLPSLYTVTCSNDTASASDSVTITNIETPDYVDCEINTTVGTPVPFQGVISRSTDVAGGSVEYRFNWGDGSITTIDGDYPTDNSTPIEPVSTTRTWNSIGTRLVTLTATPENLNRNPAREWQPYFDLYLTSPLATYISAEQNPPKVDHCLVTVREAPTTGPDLTAGTVTFGEAVTGTPVTLSSVITNNGSASTGAGFSNLFQVANNSNGTGAVSVGADTSPVLVINGTDTTSVAHTFTTAGDYYVRACADKSTSDDLGSITELNETNNCSASWTKITVVNSEPLGISCAVSPTTATTGQSVTWTATPSGGTAPYTYAWQGENLVGQTAQSPQISYSSLGTKNGSVTVTDATGAAVSASCTNSVQVCTDASCSGSGANLTAGQVTVANGSVCVNRQASLSASVTNTGTDTSGSFPVLFQIKKVSDSTEQRVASSYVSGLAANASGVGSINHTFGSAGDYEIRACANFNTSWTAIVTESNYDDNCGTPVTITVAGAGSCPSNLSCSASPSTVTTLPATVTFTASGESGPYTWSAPDLGDLGSGNTKTRTFAADAVAGQYAMEVTSSSGSSNTCYVNVGNTCSTSIDELKADPNRVNPPGSSTITWKATGTSACTLKNASGATIGSSAAGGTCSTQVSGSATVTGITTQSTYTLTCGTETKTVIVNVLPEFIEF